MNRGGMIFSRAALRRGSLGRQRPLVQVVSRPIFTDGFLSTNAFKDGRRKLRRLLVHNPETYTKRIQDTFEASGIKSIFKDDLRSLMDLASKPEDLPLLSSLIKEFLVTPTRQEDVAKYVASFFKVCKILDAPESARDLWDFCYVPQEGETLSHLSPSVTTRIVYLTLLYNNGFYEEVVEECRRSPPLSAQTQWQGKTSLLHMASLYHIGTQEAFDEAAKIHSPDAQTMSDSRLRFGVQKSSLIFALFTMKMGENALAFEVLSSVARPSRSTNDNSSELANNLKVSILLRVGRHEDALDFAERNWILSEKSYVRPLVCLEVVEELARSVADQEERLTIRFTRLCQLLDERAIIMDGTLENVVLAPIDSSEADKKFEQGSRRLRRSSRYRDEESVEEEDD